LISTDFDKRSTGKNENTKVTILQTNNKKTTSTWAEDRQTEHTTHDTRLYRV